MRQVSSAAEQCPYDLPSAVGRQVPSPPFGQSLDQHEAAAAYVIETSLVRFGRPDVLIPDLYEHCPPVGREPQMDTGRAVPIGVVRALVLIHRSRNSVGHQFGYDEFNRVG